MFPVLLITDDTENEQERQFRYLRALVRGTIQNKGRIGQNRKIMRRFYYILWDT